MKTKKQKAEYSGFILTFEPERTKWIAERIDVYELTESFSSIDIKLEKREIALLSLSDDPPSITHMVLYEKIRGNGGSAKVKMKIFELCNFDPPVQLGEINLMPEHVLTPETVSRTNHQKWNEVIAQLIEIRPAKKLSIEKIIADQKQQKVGSWDSNRGKILNEERDGIGLALDVAGLERKEILSKINEEQIATAESIIDAIDNSENYEADMLTHDQRIFSRLLTEETSRYIKFSDGRNNSVRVHITDKRKIETAAGVDLIIVDLKHNNFIFIQYKRMDKISPNGWRYNISNSSNIHDQITSMMKLKNSTETVNYSQSIDPWDYRLCENPFYFKFCEGTTRNFNKDDLTPGITIAFDYLYRHFNVSPDSTSKFAGSIGYFNCKKYLNNTEFVNLIREGWIGGNSNYIQTVSDLLKLDSSKSRRVMLAIVDSPKEESKSTRSQAYKKQQKHPTAL